MINTRNGAFVLLGAMVVVLLHVLANAVGQAPEVHTAHSREVRVRYAEAKLHLAEIELRIVLSGNEKIPNMYSMRTIRRLSNNVAHAKELLRYEMERKGNDLHDLHLQELEGELALAESELAAVVRLKNELIGSISDLEIEKLKVAVKVARLALGTAREPEVIRSREDHLQWQIDRVSTELTRLYLLMDRALSRN